MSSDAKCEVPDLPLHPEAAVRLGGFLIVFAAVIGVLAVWASSFLPADLVLRLAN